jgi:hypothetical protein
VIFAEGGRVTTKNLGLPKVERGGDVGAGSLNHRQQEVLRIVQNRGEVRRGPI